MQAARQSPPTPPDVPFGIRRFGELRLRLSTTLSIRATVPEPHFRSSPLGLHRFAGRGGLHPLPPAGAPLARSSGAWPSETYGWFALLSVWPFTVFPARPGFVGV